MNSYDASEFEFDENVEQSLTPPLRAYVCVWRIEM